MTNDMTVGRPLKLIFSFSIPLLIGNIFQQFYNMADTIIVGRTISVQALAAVGSTGAISFLVLGFAQGLTNGLAVITAQRFGANDEAGVRRSVTTSIILSIAAAFLVTIISVLTTRPLLELMQTPPDIIDDAYRYIVVIYYGIAASIFYNMISGIIRALGDSKTPLVFLIIASVFNVVLDLVFILVFRMGVAGAAWATVVAQALSGFLCLIYVAKRFPILRLRREDWSFSWSFAWKHLSVGLPMAFQFSVTAIGIMVIQGTLNTFGSDTVAGFTASSKINQLATQPVASFGVTMATYAAQNYGAGRMDRVRSGVKSCTLLSLAFSVVGGLIVVLFGGVLTRLFVGEANALVIDRSQTYLNTVAAFYFILGLLFIYRNTLQGIGKGTIPLLAGFCEVLMRTLAAIFLARWFGYIGVCLSDPVAWVGATLLLAIDYIFLMRKLSREEKKNETAVLPDN